MDPVAKCEFKWTFRFQGKEFEDFKNGKKPLIEGDYQPRGCTPPPPKADSCPTVSMSLFSAQVDSKEKPNEKNFGGLLLKKGTSKTCNEFYAWMFRKDIISKQPELTVEQKKEIDGFLSQPFQSK
jgi:hypothetical protein